MGLRYVGAKATLCCVKSNSSDRPGVFVLSRCLDIGLGQYCDTLSMTRPLSPSVKPDPVCPEGCNVCTEVDGKVSCNTCEDSLELNADDNSCRKSEYTISLSLCDAYFSGTPIGQKKGPYNISEVSLFQGLLFLGIDPPLKRSGVVYEIPMQLWVGIHNLSRVEGCLGVFISLERCSTADIID